MRIKVQPAALLTPPPPHPEAPRLHPQVAWSPSPHPHVWGQRFTLSGMHVCKLDWDGWNVIKRLLGSAEAPPKSGVCSSEVFRTCMSQWTLASLRGPANQECDSPDRLAIQLTVQGKCRAGGRKGIWTPMGPTSCPPQESVTFQGADLLTCLTSRKWTWFVHRLWPRTKHERWCVVCPCEQQP